MSCDPTPLVRLPDWRTRLAAWIAACRRRSFRYGDFDCALFAAGAVFVQTGADVRKELGGGYATARGAARLLARHGARDPVDLAARLLPQIAVAAARQGDLAGLRTGDGAALAVVGGPHLLAAAAPIGLVARPLTDAFVAFEV